MELSSVLCPACNEPAALVSKTTTYRRGPRVLPVEVHRWECTSACTVPGSDTPYRFADPQLMRLNDANARKRWLEQFGEEMPLPGRPGRKAEEPRDRRVPVLLTQTELALLDRVRGDLSRSAVLRQALQDREPRIPLPPLVEEPADAPTRRVALDVRDVA